MIKRPLMAAAFLCAVAAPAALLLPAQAAKKQPKVKFGAKKVTPKTANGGASGSASVQVNATGGATVSGVTLSLKRGSTVVSSSAMAQSGKKWTKSFTLPANATGQAFFVDVYATAASSVGPVETRIGSVKVNSSPVDNTNPPPPPPI